MDPEPAAIVVQFDPSASPISGHVSTDGAEPREFTGWTGLFAVLRTVAAEQDGAAPIRGGTTR